LFQLRIFYQIHECKIGLKWHAHAVTAFPITHRKHELTDAFVRILRGPGRGLIWFRI
jgi:hypothetical protein